MTVTMTKHYDVFSSMLAITALDIICPPNVNPELQNVRYDYALTLSPLAHRTPPAVHPFPSTLPRRYPPHNAVPDHKERGNCARRVRWSTTEHTMSVTYGARHPLIQTLTVVVV